MKALSRILAILMAIAMVLSLSACGGMTASTTTAAPETTNTPTCAANGHTWVDATCEVAKTCSVCGTTQGVALGHTWIDANYQQPKTCSVCKATEGGPLAGYFAVSGLEDRLLAPAGEYSYTLICGDETKSTVAQVIVEEHKTVPSDDTHQPMEGYEWKILRLKLHFADENAVKYSFYPGGYLWTDKYEAHVSDTEDEAKNENGVMEDLFTTGIPGSFVWNGIEYTEGWIHIEEKTTEWMQDAEGNYYIDLYITVSVRVPVGYDGFVFGLEDHTWEWTAGKYLHEVVTDNTLLFRMD